MSSKTADWDFQPWVFLIIQKQLLKTIWKSEEILVWARFILKDNWFNWPRIQVKSYSGIMSSHTRSSVFNGLSLWLSRHSHSVHEFVISVAYDLIPIPRIFMINCFSIIFIIFSGNCLRFVNYKELKVNGEAYGIFWNFLHCICLLYTSPSPRD